MFFSIRNNNKDVTVDQNKTKDKTDNSSDDLTTETALNELNDQNVKDDQNFRINLYNQSKRTVLGSLGGVGTAYLADKAAQGVGRGNLRKVKAKNENVVKGLVPFVDIGSSQVNDDTKDKDIDAIDTDQPAVISNDNEEIKEEEYGVKATGGQK